MKFISTPFILIIWIISLVPAYAQQVGGKSLETILENVDAIQAMEIANQWKWTQKGVKSDRIIIDPGPIRVSYF